MPELAFQLPTILAHRGLHTSAPENTLSAFKAAFEAGAKWIELDVMLSADHVPIIFHDDHLQRVTNGFGLVADMSFHALQQLRVISYTDNALNDEIPSLRQFLNYLTDTHLSVNLEIKSNILGDALTCQCVLADLVAWSQVEVMVVQGRLLLSSFSREVVAFFAQHAPSIPRAYLIDCFEVDAIAFARQEGCVAVNFWTSMPAAEAFVVAAVEASMPTLGFTVDDLTDAQAWLAKGVCGVFTNNAACYSLAKNNEVI